MRVASSNVVGQFRHDFCSAQAAWVAPATAVLSGLGVAVPVGLEAAVLDPAPMGSLASVSKRQ
jgi:hypothetical protein